MSEGLAPRRPPPLPPSLPRRVVPPAPAPAPSPTAPPRLAPRVEREWQPLQRPRLADEAPGADTTFGGLLAPEPTSLLQPRFAWVALMGWGFVLVVLLLVVVPTDAIPKLLPPYRQPISGAGYGPLVSIFAFVSVIVVVCGLVYMWVAMARTHEPGSDETV